MPEIFPFNGEAPPQGTGMERAQYDANNDGIVDHATLADTATTITPQTNVRFQNGYLQIRNISNNTWLYVWFANDPDSGDPVMNFNANLP